MRTRLLSLIAVVMLAAPMLFAANLQKYKNWANSPQGYFMTKAERAEWTASVKTDADAEEFIKKFLAARPAGFVDDVAQRAAMADKHLTVSGRSGSLTTRGKIVILLGPPSSFTVAKREVKGHAAFSADSYANIDPSKGPSVGDMAMAAQARDMSGDLFSDYAFTYAAEKLPVKQPKDFSVVVEVRMGDGNDRIPDRKAIAALDELFDAAAEKSLAAPAPKP